MPAPKKHSSARARANTASTAATLTDGGSAIVPTLPKRPDIIEYDSEGNRQTFETDWHEETLNWWSDLWASPMAAEYHSSDRHALFILAVLMDDFWNAPSTKLASEIRLQRVAFGLTPYDRRRLEWTIETTEEAKDRGTARRGQSSPQPSQGKDPRLALVQ